MKRLYFAIILAVLLISIVSLGTYFITSASENMNKLFDEIEYYAQKEEVEEITRLCEKAENEWVKYEKKLTYFVDHSDISKIGEDIAALTPFAKNFEKAEFFSQLESVRIKLAHLEKMERIDD